MLRNTECCYRHIMMWWSCATVTIPGRVSSLERPGRVLVARPDWRTRECCWCRPTRLLAANFWTLFAWIRSPKKLVPLTWRWCGSRCAGTDSVDKLNWVNLVFLVSASSSGAASLGRFKELFCRNWRLRENNYGGRWWQVMLLILSQSLREQFRLHPR